MQQSPITPFREKLGPIKVSVYVNDKLLPDGFSVPHLFTKGAMNFLTKAVLSLVTDRHYDLADFMPDKPVAILLGDGVHQQLIFEGVIVAHEIRAHHPEVSNIKLLCLTTTVAMGMEEPYTQALGNVPGPFLTLTAGTDIIDYSISQCNEPDPYNPEWFCGRFSFPGSALAAIHTRIQIDEKLQPYRNEYPYIAGVEHRLENGIWTSTVELGKAGRVNLKDW